MKSEIYEKIALQFLTEEHRNRHQLQEGMLEEAKELEEAFTEGSYLECLYELGDMLWYITVMAEARGISLGQIMNSNIHKLEERALNGKK